MVNEDASLFASLLVAWLLFFLHPLLSFCHLNCLNVTQSPTKDEDSAAEGSSGEKCLMWLKFSHFWHY